MQENDHVKLGMVLMKNDESSKLDLLGVLLELSLTHIVFIYKYM